MKKITSLICMSLFAGYAIAQDAVHGVGGYYSYTASQFKADGNLTRDTNGQKVKAWYPGITYTEDGYVDFRLGLNNTTYDKTNGGFAWRSGLNLKESASGAGVLTLNKNYPVIAIKFSMPTNNERKSGIDYFEPGFNWYNPNTGVSEKFPMSGLDGNGRKRFIEHKPYLKGIDGKDSLKFNTIITTNTTTNKKDTIGWLYRVNDDKANVILMMDTRTMAHWDTIQSIKMQNIGLGFFAQSDTTHYEIGTAGDTISTRVKTLDEVPNAFVKWMRTFKSKAELEKFISYNNGDGNDPRSDNQITLNTKIYYANQFVLNYPFADEEFLIPLQDAIAVATDIYNTKTDDTSVLQAITDLKTAQSNFLAAIAMVPNDIYNKITTADGQYELTLSGDNSTIGSYTGKKLTVGGKGSANGFMVTAYGEVDGQKTYRLSTAKGTIIQATDGSLILVPSAQVTATNPALFVFSNRSAKDEPMYDFKVGTKYYYVNANGLLTFTNALPVVDEIGEMSNYLFLVSDATGDYDSSNDKATLFTGWEFNNPVTTDTEFNTPSVEGWRMNKYRMMTKVGQKTVNGAGYLVISATPNYYAASDTLLTTPLVTDFSVGQTLLINREHGKYANAGSPEPISNVRDSLYLINLNSYKQRYMAMKIASNTEGIGLSSFGLFVKKGVDEPGFNLTNAAGKKGDVIYWDMLANGIPYGDKGYCAQYLSFATFTNDTQKVYIDWIRTYSSISEIPEETISTSVLNTGIENISSNGNANILVNNNLITVNSADAAQLNITRVDGVSVCSKNIIGQASVAVQSGIYVVSLVTNNKVVTKKVLVK